jgi:hypothetical protein
MRPDHNSHVYLWRRSRFGGLPGGFGHVNALRCCYGHQGDMSTITANANQLTGKNCIVSSAIDVVGIRMSCTMQTSTPEGEPLAEQC